MLGKKKIYGDDQKSTSMSNYSMKTGYLQIKLSDSVVTENALPRYTVTRPLIHQPDL